ncbi:MAG: hypothetical protein J6X49_05510 [Victivallales bacterium]|nr:hypothetical protein [Victivallales bacterium]
MLRGVHPGKQPPPVWQTMMACDDGNDGCYENAAARDVEHGVPWEVWRCQKAHSQYDGTADEKRKHQQAEKVSPETNEPQSSPEMLGGIF